jgi:non-canonical (house-cleaning) NTP pyrophosphatase
MSKNPLMSNIAPPAQLPDFLLGQQKQDEETAAVKFAAIPPEKQQTNIESGVEQKDVKKNDLPALPVQELAEALSPLTEGVKNSMIFGWMKEGIKNSLEVAKDSVQKVVVTLDPQMSGILFTGGDIEVIVASTNDDKIDPVRQSFQQIFKKATVYGNGAQAKSIAAQPVGFENAELSAKERINFLRSKEEFVDKTIMSVENFLVEITKDSWFDVGLLYFSDPRKNITLKTYTQMTPIPLDIIKKIQLDTPSDYEKKDTGYSVTIGSVMSKKLNVPHYEWHKAYISIERYDLILNAATSLASIYKMELSKLTAKLEDKAGEE